MALSQPSLLDDLAREQPKKRGHVPASSVEAWLTVDSGERVVVVTRLLMNFSGAVTSQEVAQTFRHPPSWDDTRWLLFIRRGLSDAFRKGLVEHAGKRTCSVAKTSAITWKVRSR